MAELLGSFVPGALGPFCGCFCPRLPASFHLRVTSWLLERMLALSPLPLLSLSPPTKISSMASVGDFCAGVL